MMLVTRTVAVAACVIGASMAGSNGILAAGRGLQNPSPPDAAVTLRFDRTIDPDAVTVYYEAGSLHGGLRGQCGVRAPMLAAINSREIKVPIVGIGDAPVTKLWAVVYVAGFQVAFVEVPSFADEASREATVPLSPLGTIVLRGRAPLSSLAAATALSVVADYTIDPLVTGFFSRVNPPCTGGCGGSRISCHLTAGRAPVARDGTFRLSLPDLWRDPAVAALPDRGRYNLMVTGAGINVLLRPADATAEPFGLPVAASYDRVIRFVPGRW